jgi:hypothetical protein
MTPRASQAGLPHLVRWRRATARLVTLAGIDPPPPALVAEAFALQRQCERLAAALALVGQHELDSRRNRAGADPLPSIHTQPHIGRARPHR